MLNNNFDPLEKLNILESDVKQISNHHVQLSNILVTQSQTINQLTTQLNQVVQHINIQNQEIERLKLRIANCDNVLLDFFQRNK